MMKRVNPRSRKLQQDFPRQDTTKKSFFHLCRGKFLLIQRKSFNLSKCLSFSYEPQLTFFIFLIVTKVSRDVDEETRAAGNEGKGAKSHFFFLHSLTYQISIGQS